jgi:NRPS condensation-like uncharacterized protein
MMARERGMVCDILLAAYLKVNIVWDMNEIWTALYQTLSAGMEGKRTE